VFVFEGERKMVCVVNGVENQNLLDLMRAGVIDTAVEEGFLVVVAESDFVVVVVAELTVVVE